MKKIFLSTIALYASKDIQEAVRDKFGEKDIPYQEALDYLVEKGARSSAIYLMESLGRDFELEPLVVSSGSKQVIVYAGPVVITSSELLGTVIAAGDIKSTCSMYVDGDIKSLTGKIASLGRIFAKNITSSKDIFAKGVIDSTYEIVSQEGGIEGGVIRSWRGAFALRDIVAGDINVGQDLRSADGSVISQGEIVAHSVMAKKNISASRSIIVPGRIAAEGFIHVGSNYRIYAGMAFSHDDNTPTISARKKPRNIAVGKFKKM